MSTDRDFFDTLDNAYDESAEQRLRKAGFVPGRLIGRRTRGGGVNVSTLWYWPDSSGDPCVRTLRARHGGQSGPQPKTPETLPLPLDQIS